MSVSLAKHKKESKATVLLKIPDEDLLRHAALAFEEGYADARTWGQDGFFISSGYNAYDRERYCEGFNRGLRVWKVMQNAR